MNRAKSIVSAVAAMLCAGAVPAAAQVVIGGSTPDVQVNWAVLDRLGPPPTLPGMLENKVAADHHAVAAAAPASGHVVYKPYRGAHHAKTAIHHAKAKAHPKKKAEPANTPSMNQLVQAAHAVAPAPQPPLAQPVAHETAVPAAAPPPKPAAADLPPAASPAAGPQVSLPQTAAAPAAPAPAQAPAASPAAAPASAEPAATPVQPVAAPSAEPAPAAAAPQAQLPPTPVVQTAALPSKPSGAVSRKGDSLSVLFDGDAVVLPDGARAELNSLAQRMSKDDSLGLQLLSYAQGDADNFGKARRVSLSRALEVRKYLMEQGVRSTRIDVRALGAKQDGDGPADRVDAVLVSH